MFSFGDSFRNFLAGLGVIGRDKSAHQVPHLQLLSVRDLEALYRADWISRKIVELPAFDATRAWRQWQAENEQIEALEAMEKAFGLQRKMMSALIKARLYGGAAIVLGVAQGKFNEPLDFDKIKKGDLRFVHVVERNMIQAGQLVRDITSPWFGEPSYYMRSNMPTTGAPGNVELPQPIDLGSETSDVLYIHPSRVVRLVGLEYPDMEHATDAWGDSVLQPVYDAVRDTNLVGQSIASLTSRANVNVIKVPGLTQNMQTDAGTQRVINRFANANAAQSVVNSLLVDKDEDWTQLQVQFGNLDKIHQMYLLIACAAADIPSTRFMSREPAGQNSTGESDLRNYYDRLSSEQAVKFTPLLNRLDEVLIRSTFGERDPDIHYAWNPLWQMTPDQKADVAFKKAQAFKIDVDSGLMDPVVLREARQNQLIEDGTYPGLEAAIDDVENVPDDDVEEDDDSSTVSDDMPGSQGELGFVVPFRKKKKKKVRDDYNESLHPREHGKWVSAGGFQAELSRRLELNALRLQSRQYLQAQRAAQALMDQPKSQRAIWHAASQFTQKHTIAIGVHFAIHPVIHTVSSVLVGALTTMGGGGAIESLASTVATYSVLQVVHSLHLDQHVKNGLSEAKDLLVTAAKNLKVAHDPEFETYGDSADDDIFDWLDQFIDAVQDVDELPEAAE